MDIDELFKVRILMFMLIFRLKFTKFKAPKVPMGGNKRRMPDAPTPEMLKRMKMDVSSKPVNGSESMMPPPPPNGMSAKAKGKGRAVTVEDEGEEEPMDQDTEPDFAPGNDADYYVEEDDEGRFFGGGLTSEQKTILSIFEKAGGEGEDGGAAADDVSSFAF